MQVELFERKIMLRISRGLLLVIGGLIFLGLVGSAFWFIYGVLPAIRGLEPGKPDPLTAATVSADEVKAKMRGEPVPQAMESPEPPPMPEPIVPPTDAWIAELEPLLAQIQTYFPGNGAPWYDTRSTYCAQYHYYFTSKCIDWKTRTLAGLRSSIITKIKSWDQATRKAYLEAIIAFLPKADGPNRKEILEYFLTTKSEGTALVQVGKAMPDVLTIITGQNQVWFMNNLAKLFPQQEPYASNITRGMVASLDVLPLLPEDARPMAIFQLAAFLAVDEDSVDLAKSVAANMKSVLESFPLESRKEAVSIFSDIYNEKMASAMQAYRLAMSERESKIMDMNAKYTKKKERKKEARYQGLVGIGGALGSLAIIGWFLALLAIERNTRAINRFIENERNVRM